MEDFADLLGRYTVRAGLTQQALANKIGVHRSTIVKWMNRTSRPVSRGQVLRLADELFLSKEERKTLLTAAGFSLERWPAEIWTIPSQRDAFFTGRDDVFWSLRERLTPGGRAVLTQAISGMGGIGKTHMAIEYAYRYHQDYEAVLWLQADSWETLVLACMRMASELGLPEQKETDRVVTDVQRWLHNHRKWLLILDNVMDPQVLSRFVPAGHQGSVLVTTRMQNLEPLAQTSVLATMSEQEGVLFLLRRTKQIALTADIEQVTPAQYEEARQIWQLMEGLPLALDQAGAYILETGCSLSEYREQYARQRAALLNRRGKLVIGHESSVATSFLLAFERVEALNPLSTHILRVCSLLERGDIPEEIFLEGAAHLGPLRALDRLGWDTAISALQDYSLVQHNRNENTLAVHRLVQTIMQDTLSEQERGVWIERIIAALDSIFPEVEPISWSQCERLVPHTLACAIHTQSGKYSTPALASLLFKTATYLSTRSQQAEADVLFQRALQIQEQLLGSDHPDVIYFRHNLVGQGQESEVRRFFEDAGFRFTGLDAPGSFLCFPATPLWQKKIKHEVYAHVITGKPLDGNEIIRIHDAAQGRSKDVTLAFAIVDKPVEDQAWLQIAALRANNFSVIPIPLTLVFENQIRGKVAAASMLLEKHIERFLGTGADPYNIRHPVFDVLNFFGREGLARDLMEQMNAGQPIGLFGLRKIGKSSLMRYLRGVMPCPTAYLDLQAGVELTGLYERLLHSWNNDARVRFRLDLALSDGNITTGNPTTEFFRTTQTALDRMASQTPEAHLAIFLDEIELLIPPVHASGTTVEHSLSLLRTLRGLVQEDGRISLMVAGVDPAITRISRWGDEQQQNPFYLLLKDLYLPPLHELDCIQMIRNIGTQVELSYSEEAATYVAQMSGGHPYLARQLCSLAYGQRRHRPGEVTHSAMRHAVERFLYDPKYAASLNASGMWGEVTNVKLWGEQAARANQQVLFALAQSPDPLAESVLTDGPDEAAFRSALFSLHELNVIHPIEDSLSSSEPSYTISFGLFQAWIQRIRLGLDGGA